MWCDEPEEVNVYDFLSDAECRATPYGIYDLLAGRGHVCVGTSADTPAFAVEAIGTWWARYGCKRYRGADELLILADGGGSNGHRPRLWKTSLQERIADRYGLARDGLPLPDGGVEVEPGGAPAVRPGEHQLGGPAAAEPGDPAGLGPRDGGRRRGGDGEPGPGDATPPR